MLFAGVLAVEGYHAGAIRTVLYEQRTAETPYNTTVADAVNEFGLLRGKLGAGAGQGLVSDPNSPGAGSNLVAADNQHLAFYRSPSQASFLQSGSTAALQVCASRNLEFWLLACFCMIMNTGHRGGNAKCRVHQSPCCPRSCIPSMLGIFACCTLPAMSHAQS